MNYGSAIFLLFLIILFLGLAYLYKEFFLKLLILSILIFLYYKFTEQSFILNSVPDALNVNSISYREEESSGFGGSGSEAGIRVYPLSEKISKKIIASDITFFNNLPIKTNPSNGERVYLKWLKTPIKPNEYWGNKKIGELNVYDYICFYNCELEIKPSVQKQANLIVNNKGSYYSYSGDSRLIVVSPNKKVVLFFYNSF